MEVNAALLCWRLADWGWRVAHSAGSMVSSKRWLLPRVVARILRLELPVEAFYGNKRLRAWEHRRRVIHFILEAVRVTCNTSLESIAQYRIWIQNRLTSNSPGDRSDQTLLPSSRKTKINFNNRQYMYILKNWSATSTESDMKKRARKIQLENVPKIWERLKISETKMYTQKSRQRSIGVERMSSRLCKRSYEAVP